MDINTRRPAIVQPKDNARYFAETNPAGNGLTVTIEPWRENGSRCRVVVRRLPKRDHAGLRLEVRNLGQMVAELTPYQLRRLASDLLDAAADIEAHPVGPMAAPSPAPATTQATAVLEAA